MEEMHWIEGGKRFLWLSEREGWQHLYVVSVANQEITLLTPGAFDVISIAGVDEPQGCVYFLTSPDNPTQRYPLLIHDQERYLGLPADNEAGFRNGSPITFAHQMKSILLLAHGTGDDNCHYQNCEVLANELLRQNKPFAQMPYPNRAPAIQEGENSKRHLFETLTRYLEAPLPVTP